MGPRREFYRQYWQGLVASQRFSSQRFSSPFWCRST
jgi:hypothetical protein